jgi:hypothetical protein
MSELDRLFAESAEWRAKQEQKHKDRETVATTVRLVANLPYVIGLTLCLAWFL